MGKSKRETTSQQQTQQSFERTFNQQEEQSRREQLARQEAVQALPTAFEEQLLNLLSQGTAQLIPQVTGVSQRLSQFIEPLTQGRPLPGIFESLGTGIPEETQQAIIQRSLQDIAPQFERLGIGASGPAAQISANLARDVRIQSALDAIRQRENLLALLPGFQAQATFGPAQSLTNILAGLLPGLRTGISAATGETIGEALAKLTGTERGTSTGITTGRDLFRFNPFQESFFSSLGTGLGSGITKALFGS